MNRVTCFLILFGASLSVHAEFRVWKSEDGGVQVTAEFVRLEKDQVILRRENGVTLKVPLLSLCETDRALVNGEKPSVIPPDDETGPMQEIRLQFPNPMFIGLPMAVMLPNLETPDPSKVIKAFMAPKGTVNVAKGKKVTSSDAAPIIGDLTLVTDGDADGADGNFVELAPGHHWIQIDLETSHHIRKIALWHYHKQAGAYLDVCVQASDDPEFKKGVVTLFNNDHDNSSGLGFGKDPAYIETNHGRVIDGKAVKARYIRLYSNGNTTSDMNHYCEVQVFAVPAAGAAPAPAK